jgi:hypothetical protein
MSDSTTETLTGVVTHPPSASKDQRKRKQFTEIELQQLIFFITSRLEKVIAANGALYKPGWGVITAVSKEFGTTPQNISRLWAEAKANRANPNIACYTILPKKPGNFTAKTKYDRELFKMELAALEPKNCNSLCAISRKLLVPFTTVQ